MNSVFGDDEDDDDNFVFNEESFRAAEEKAKNASREQLLSRLNRRLGYDNKDADKQYVNEFNEFTKIKPNKKDNFENFNKLDFEKTMEMFRRKEKLGGGGELGRDYLSSDESSHGSQNLGSSPDVDEFGDDDFLKDEDLPQSLRDQYTARWKKYEALDREKERNMGERNVLHNVYENIKKQLGPTGKTIMAKFEKYKNTEQSFLEKELKKCDLLEDVMKSSSRAFERFGDKDLDDLNFGESTSGQNEAFYNNLFDEAVKSTKSNNEHFNEVSRILNNSVDDNLTKWLNFKYPNMNERSGATTFQNNNDATGKSFGKPSNERDAMNTPSPSLKKPWGLPSSLVKVNRERSKNTSTMNTKKPWR